MSSTAQVQAGTRGQRADSPPAAVVLDYASLAAQDLDTEALWQLPIAWQRWQATTAAETAERIAGKQIILSNKVLIQRQHFEANPQLKLVIILATGTNNVDLVAAREHGVAVCNIVDYSTHSVVQHTIAAMLNLRCRLADYQQAVQAGSWSRSQFFGLLDFPVSEVAGTQLGIIGYGQIGRGVAKVAQALGMQVAVAQSLRPEAQPQPDRLPLRTLLETSDVVSLHCPLSEFSAGLLDAEKLSWMKPSALLINTARGGIVDESALLEALEQQRLGGAALDVLAQEPPSTEHPLIAAAHPRLLLTPHIAWSSQQARQRLIEQVASILVAMLQAQPLPNQLP